MNYSRFVNFFSSLTREEIKKINKIQAAQTTIRSKAIYQIKGIESCNNSINSKGICEPISDFFNQVCQCAIQRKRENFQEDLVKLKFLLQNIKYGPYS